MTGRVRNTVIATLLFTVSAMYYYALSAKIWTWLYVSGDSGDWLQFLNWWVVPQPFGSPLFVGAIRLLGMLPVDNPYVLLTVVLSIIPAAVTVATAYFIGLELTKEWKLGIVSSLITLGSATLLTQATVFEQYAVVVMLASLAFLFYLKNNLKLTVLFLGLGLANHILMLLVAVVWVFAEWKRRRLLVRLLPIYVVTGILPYALVLWLFMADVPRLFAGGLSLQSVMQFFDSSSVMGQLPITETLRRITEMGAVIVASLGVAIYPLVYGLRKPRTNKARFTVILSALLLWVWFSCTFLTPYKYLLVVSAVLSGYAVYGLSRMPNWNRYVVAVGAIVLMVANSVSLNADKLSRLDPQATEFYNAVMELPDKSVVLTPRGGAFGFSLFYALSDGKDVVPVNLMPNNDQMEWLKDNYDVVGNNSMEIAQDALNRGLDVYFVSPINPLGWGKIFETDDTGTYGLRKVKSVKAMSWDEVK